jgi:hypothetical protein
MLTPAQIQTYRREGFVVVPQFFTSAETERLYAIAAGDETMLRNAFGTLDKTGKQTRLTLWYTPGDDIYGLVSRSRRMIESVAQLLDSEAPVCHYHSKLMQKEPRVGGAWEWHQDYGYWYKNQFMYPEQMISVMVAITQATKENGCLQVIRGSHKLGRVNHLFSGEQVGADMEFVENALKTLELVYCELNPGDGLFFHANLLHRSAANLSDNSRWSMISCYNAQSNPAYNEPSTSYQIPVKVIPDEAILAWEALPVADSADFLQKENDNALKETHWETKAPA